MIMASNILLGLTTTAPTGEFFCEVLGVSTRTQQGICRQADNEEHRHLTGDQRSKTRLV